MAILALLLVGAAFAFGSRSVEPETITQDFNAWLTGVSILLVVAFMLGRRFGYERGHAVAVARADARAAAAARSEASATAQQFVQIHVDSGAARVAREEYGGLDESAWRGETRQQIDGDEQLHIAAEELGDFEHVEDVWQGLPEQS